MKEDKKEQINDVVEAVLRSSKYRNVSEDLIRNIGSHELAKGSNLREAIKATKNRLHQIGGAYFLGRPQYKSWLKKLRAAKHSSDENLFRETCTDIMSNHASTKERLKILDQFHKEIFSSIPAVRRIVDLACGFHPLSIPWMPLASETEYYAYDVYEDLIRFINEFLVLTGTKGYAEARDVTQHVPREEADLAFILNTLPCLEHVDKSSGLEIVENVSAKFLAVSFPTKSLGGREKNMRSFYEEGFNRLAEERKWTVRKLDFETELVFLINKLRKW